MQAFGFESDDLLDFVGDLREYGYRITTEQCISAQNLLVALAAYGNSEDVAERLGAYLAPILCTSPEEQENFERYFQRWQSQPALSLTAVKETARPKGYAVPFRKVYQGLRTRSPIREAIIGVLFISFIISVIIFFIPVSPQLEKKNLQLPPLTASVGHVTDNQGAPVAGATIKSDEGTDISDSLGRYFAIYRLGNLPNIVVSHPDYKTVRGVGNLEVVLSEKKEIGVEDLSPTPTPVPIPVPTPESSYTTTALLATSAVLLLTVIAWAFWVVTRRLILRKKLARENVRVEQLMVKGAGEQFARLLALRRTAQELRRPRPRDVSDLDVAATSVRTIEKGIFTPGYHSRKASPEYLALIDRASFNDQQASLEDEIVRRMAGSDVYIDRFYFQTDPRLCREEGTKTSYHSLQDLAATHPNHRLIIFSDADGLFDPVSGKPQGWLGTFSHWADRALLTPRNITDAYRRRVLSELDFVVLPADRKSLSALADMFNGIPLTTKEGGHQEPFPGLLLERPERWLERHPPAANLVEDLIGQLRRFLGAEGYHWLGACAVYPMLHWDLTFFLGYKLGQGVRLEEGFRALVQLPWFRHGSIPDWLRTRLIHGLSGAQQRQVRKALEELLVSSVIEPVGLHLPLVRERRGGRRDLESFS